MCVGKANCSLPWLFVTIDKEMRFKTVIPVFGITKLVRLCSLLGWPLATVGAVF